MPCLPGKMFSFVHRRLIFILFVIINTIFKCEITAIYVKVARFLHDETMDNYTILVSSEMTDVSWSECGLKCTQAPYCEAFSHNAVLEKCLLSHRRAPDNISAEEGWKFYQKYPGIALYIVSYCKFANPSNTLCSIILVDVLFWGRRDFPISFSNKDTSWNAWNRHLTSFIVDKGGLSINMKFPSYEC